MWDALSPPFRYESVTNPSLEEQGLNLRPWHGGTEMVQGDGSQNCNSIRNIFKGNLKNDEKMFVNFNVFQSLNKLNIVKGEIGPCD